MDSWSRRVVAFFCSTVAVLCAIRGLLSQVNQCEERSVRLALTTDAKQVAWKMFLQRRRRKQKTKKRKKDRKESIVVEMPPSLNAYQQLYTYSTTCQKQCPSLRSENSEKLGNGTKTGQILKFSSISAFFPFLTTFENTLGVEVIAALI